MSDPWFKFFPSDWRSDEGLRMCSLAARGLWIEMLAIMHKAAPRGELRVAGLPIQDAELAQAIGLSEESVKAALAELERNKVFSRSRNGVIYSRRMIRDAARRKRATEAGGAGGNPRLTGGRNAPGFVYMIERKSDGHVLVASSVTPRNRLYKLRQAHKGDQLDLIAQAPVADMAVAVSELETYLQGVSGIGRSGQWWGLNRDQRQSLSVCFDSEKGLTLKGQSNPHIPETRNQTPKGGEGETDLPGDMGDQVKVLAGRVAEAYPERAIRRMNPMMLQAQCFRFLRDGGDADALVKACRAYAEAEGQAPRNFDFFLSNLWENYKPKDSRVQSEPREMSDADWRGWVDVFERRGDWDERLGPKPGREGCRAPAHIQREYHYEPKPRRAAGGN